MWILKKCTESKLNDLFINRNISNVRTILYANKIIESLTITNTA